MISLTIIIYLFLSFLNAITAKKYFFSVIISTYNSGRYLDDSIGSIVKQTLSIEKIQIILVNDGSIDNTEDICLKYKSIYPYNIIYIKIEHRGVSIGRNIGKNYADGDFINFLDADDKWDKNAFKIALLFFRFHKDINFVGCRMIFFEAKEAYHPLDYKFYKTRKVNISEEYNCIQLSTSSSFFRYSLIKNEKFEEGIFNGEDTRFINNILLVNPIMGLLKEAIYYYRKRVDSTSTIQNKVKNEEYYSFIIKSVDRYLLEKSKKLYNEIPPFIQFYIAYNTLFRIILPSYKYLNKSKFNEYREIIETNLRQIEDKYILEQKILSIKQKILALSRKYNNDIVKNIIFQNNSFIYSGNVLLNITEDKGIIIWRILDIKKYYLHLEGKDNLFLPSDNYFYFCISGDNKYYPKYLNYFGYDIITMYKNTYKGRIVIFDIPLKNENNQIIKFFISYKGIDIEIYPSLGWFTHTPNINNGYYNSGDYILKIIEQRINIFKYNDSLQESFENQYCNELKKLKKDNLIKLRSNFIKFNKKTKNERSEIWIINDKINLAGDNGEFFFRFLKKKKPKGIKAYFVINSNCSDFQRLKSLGDILKFGSEIYFDIFLKSDKIISSVYESWVDNPFINDFKYIRDLIHFDFIFIQHGIIKDNLSKFINRLGRNLSLIITSSIKEYKSILNDNYGYKKNNIILTGLPRYDELTRLRNFVAKEKIILILPTWRMYIKGTFNSKTYESIYSQTFNSTDFFKFYNSLINNDELLLIMDKLNYSGIFCLHPYFSKQWIDFKSNRLFLVNEICNYQNLLLKSSLLITDYSSIFFDFAYMKKPVIYAHFDYEEYRNNHYQKGYFDYLKHGFGPICYDLKCTINKIILKISNNCLNEKLYLKRTERFFKYNDDNNCERLYNNLLNNSFRNINSNERINIFAYIFIFIGFIIKIKKFLYTN